MVIESTIFCFLVVLFSCGLHIYFTQLWDTRITMCIKRYGISVPSLLFLEVKKCLV